MNLLLLLLSLGWVLHVVMGAPGFSSVHARFVSGNRATQYSHGTGGDVNLIKYILVGNQVGTLRNLSGSRSSHVVGAGPHVASNTPHNPEALAPEGVFTPPLATEASHYVKNDPYLADPHTAAYAAKHPPFFKKFPHKRTVLALNERREDNGLEPNLLRSIRPFFPFFELHK